MQNHVDKNGAVIGERYSVILHDAEFEKKLQWFDPNLKLLFDHIDKRWKILEREIGQPKDERPRWNLIFTAQDEHGNPKQLGDWVINKLFVMRLEHEKKIKVGVDAWMNDLAYQAQKQREEIEEKASDNSRAQLREDVLQWRKAAKELDGLPTSDVTAGFRKVIPIKRKVNHANDERLA